MFKKNKYESGSINEYLNGVDIKINILIYSRIIQILKDCGIQYHAIISSDNVKFEDVKQMVVMILSSMPLSLVWVLNELSGGELVSKFDLNIENEEDCRKLVLRDIDVNVIEKMLMSFFSRLPESLKNSMLKLIDGLKVQRNSDIAMRTKALLETQEFLTLMDSIKKKDQLKENLE